MSTHLYYNDKAIKHITPNGHPECIERYENLKNNFILDERNIFNGLKKIECQPVDAISALGAHTQRHVEDIIAKNTRQEFISLDADTTLSPHSLVATQHALGAAIAGTDAVFQGHATNCFSIQRPPGHHAESDRAMGFCIFNHIACAAFHARKKYGAERVVVIDFDVHHGNGTQEIFWDQKDLFYCSTHQMPFYPGTGAKNETGMHNNICNAPLHARDGSSAFKDAYKGIIFPFLEKIQPDFVLISAGFDAHKDDPLGDIMLCEDDFEWITKKICDYANKYANNRIVSILEGGYNIPALVSCASTHVQALMDV